MRHLIFLCLLLISANELYAQACAPKSPNSITSTLDILRKVSAQTDRKTTQTDRKTKEPVEPNSSPASLTETYISTSEDFEPYGSEIKWKDLEQMVLKITTKVDGIEVNGTGFLISPDGYFLTTLHGLEAALQDRLNQQDLSTPIEAKGYEAKIGSDTYHFSIVSHPNYKDVSQDQAVLASIKSRDFVVAKLELPAEKKLPFFDLSKKNGLGHSSDLAESETEAKLGKFNQIPLTFIPGFPALEKSNGSFQIGVGFMTYFETGHRGFLMGPLEGAFDLQSTKSESELPLYERLKKGPHLVGGSSGSPVINREGTLLGLLRSAGETTASVVSINSVLSTLFQQERPTEPALLEVKAWVREDDAEKGPGFKRETLKSFYLKR